MGRWLLIYPSLLLIAFTGANSQSAEQPSKGTAPATAEARTSATEADCQGSPDQIRACGNRWYNDCLADWDTQTHMSKREYGRVCRRVADERVKFLLEQRSNEDHPPQKSRQGS
ncbi:MAG TPA: hypothetical protein VKF35_24760 [Hyphomicrobiaceae bacterium]|jgi:hypothetical protein|nr:hypothetical protein [Hyphomicrobiaceae bacterium]